MNRKQFIEQVKRFNEHFGLKPEESYVAAGGALLMYGMRESTDDVDLTLKPEVYDRLKVDRYAPFSYPKTGNSPAITGFVFNKFIDAHRETTPWRIEVIDGIGVQLLEDVLKMKMAMNRPKDQDDIRAIHQYIAIHRRGSNES